MKFNIIPNFPRSLSTNPFSWPSWMDSDDDFPALNSGSGLTIYEDGNNIVAEAAVPGIDPKDIKVTYERGMLWIRGQMKTEEKDKQRKYYSRSSSSFSYRFSVPDEVDTSAEPKVVMQNGVVTVTFTKTKNKELKELPIEVK